MSPKSKPGEVSCICGGAGWKVSELWATELDWKLAVEEKSCGGWLFSAEGIALKGVSPNGSSIGWLSTVDADDSAMNVDPGADSVGISASDVAVVEVEGTIARTSEREPSRSMSPLLAGGAAAGAKLRGSNSSKVLGSWFAGAAVVPGSLAPGL